jgi:hypothetical protein
MQKWEYLPVWVEHQEVTAVNGQELEKQQVGSGDLSAQTQSLHDFLSRVGEDGWELVSHKMPNIGTQIFVFKRPK